MKNYVLCAFGLIVLLALSRCMPVPSPICPRDFVAGMNRSGTTAAACAMNPTDQALYTAACACVTKQSSASHHQTIPTTIHQILLGEPTELSDAQARSKASFQQFHPAFQYLLWTKDLYEPLVCATIGAAWATVPESLRYDVIAACILQSQGGVVVSFDEECVASVAPVLDCGSCLLCFEPPLDAPLFGRQLFLSPAFIAATPHHPFMHYWLQALLATTTPHVTPIFSAYLLSSVATDYAPACDGTLLLNPAYACPVSPTCIKEFISRVEGRCSISGIQHLLEFLHIRRVPPYARLTRETIALHRLGGVLSLVLDDHDTRTEQPCCT